MGMTDMSPASATRDATSGDTGIRNDSGDSKSSGMPDAMASPRARHCSERRNVFSMTAISACASKGLEMASMAPVCCTNVSRMRSDLALMSTTGNARSRESCRMARQS